MRRALVLFSALVVLLAGQLPIARANDDHVVFEHVRGLQKKWVAWALGSDTAPFLDPTFCGERVGNKFFLTGATQPLIEVDCEIEYGVPIVASPGGGAAWRSSPDMTDEELLAARDADFATICCARVRLDGESIDESPGFAETGVNTIPVGEDSFIREVDPTFPSAWTETEVASAAWVVKFVDLPRGQHRLVLRDRINGDPFKAIFHITVVR